jgi:hypothetical protein
LAQHRRLAHLHPEVSEDKVKDAIDRRNQQNCSAAKKYVM